MIINFAVVLCKKGNYFTLALMANGFSTAGLDVFLWLDVGKSIIFNN